jgi:hypothetical protein
MIRERTIEGLGRTKIQGTKLGGPRGSKDSKPRPKAGYFIREAKKIQKIARRVNREK